jgi:hypothetical protein
LELTNSLILQPNDIGLALYDNPVGQLAWIGGGIKLWSDPRAGTGPSALTHTAILTSVSLYYLTGSFQSSVWQYARNAGAARTEYTKPPTDAPMLYSIYAYNVAFWPQEYVEKVGNLVSYKGVLICMGVVVMRLKLNSVFQNTTSAGILPGWTTLRRSLKISERWGFTSSE